MRAGSRSIRAAVGSLFMTGVYWLIRRTGKRWWLWSGGLIALVLRSHAAGADPDRTPFNNMSRCRPARFAMPWLKMAGRAGGAPPKSVHVQRLAVLVIFHRQCQRSWHSLRVAISDVASRMRRLTRFAPSPVTRSATMCSSNTYLGRDLGLSRSPRSCLLARGPDASHSSRWLFTSNCEDRRPARNWLCCCLSSGGGAC